VDAIYILTPVLLIIVIVASVWLDRWSVPVILVALGAGIVFGSDVLGLWHFGDFDLTNKIANAALVFILFNGGFGTRKDGLRSVALPAGGLATWGVVLTAAAAFLILWGPLGWSFEESLLVAVILSIAIQGSTLGPLSKALGLELPPGAVITMVTRGKDVLAPKGGTRLMGWDQVTVLAHAKDEVRIREALLGPFRA
jgi:NhaP-type Na+/H+ and K+/H+ antiporter